jgi:hypothetical protein
MVDEAVCAASRNNAARKRLHHGASAVEPHPGALLGGAVAISALGPEDRQHIAAEVDFAVDRGLGWGDGSDKS